MNTFRVAMLMLTMLGIQLVLRADDPKVEKKTLAKIPDLSGAWSSDSPLDQFVRDESPQPVNSFRIERSTTADYDAFYIGKRAVGIPLKWSDELQRFEGTTRNGQVTFVVTPTNDPNVLKVEITLPNGADKSHSDKWRRADVKASRVRTPNEEKTSKPDKSAKQPILDYDEDDKAMSEEAKTRLEVMMVDFYVYMESVGFKLQKGHCKFRTQRDMRNAHYFHNISSIVIDPNYLADDSIIYREFTHHALAVSLGDDATEIFQKCSGIESALADYFGCSACDDPIVGRIMALVDRGPANGGQVFLRRMDNQRKFTEVNSSAGRHDVGEVVSGALWEIRDAIDKDVVDELIFTAWIGIAKADSSNGQIVRFFTSLIDVAKKEHEEYAATIREIVKRRGLELPDK